MNNDAAYIKKLEEQLKNANTQVEELTISTRTLNLEKTKVELELTKSNSNLEKVKAELEEIYAVFEHKKIQGTLNFSMDNNKIPENHPMILHAKKIIAEVESKKTKEEASA